MTRPTRLGDAEREALDALHRRGGVHDARKDRPLWENAYWTLQLMASLSRKGCVKVTGPGVFEITTHGKIAAIDGNPSR